MEPNHTGHGPDIQELHQRLYTMEKELKEIRSLLQQNVQLLEQLQRKNLITKERERPETVTAGGTVIVRM